MLETLTAPVAPATALDWHSKPSAGHTAEDCTDPWECQEKGWSRV